MRWSVYEHFAISLILTSELLMIVLHYLRWSIYGQR
jgi:hypothetical protein